ncbi:MAG: peptidylprolyl isomerase [Planctomycetes bacterium]|nr:peptidylprolyl isomerase [Planctomycetota bacterium]
MENRVWSFGPALAPAFAACAAALLALPGCLSPRGAEAPPPVPAVLAALEDAPWADPGRVIAEVDGRPLTQGELYKRILRQYGTARLLTGVITQDLVIEEARRGGLSASREEVARKVDEVLETEARRAGGRDALEREYARAGLTLQDVRRDHEREVGTQILLAKVVKSMRQVDDEVLRKYYQETYASTRYQARHVAFSFRPEQGQGEEDLPRLKLEAYNKAARAADRIRKGADFAALARAESQDPVTAERGGDLGLVRNDGRVPEFMRKVFDLRAGDVSDPVENPLGGYHVFQVTAVVAGESFVDCKDAMRREILEAEPSLEEVASVLMKLRADAKVRILEGGGAVERPEGQGNEGGARER